MVCLCVCVCIVCRLWENNSHCVHKTEEGFSFAGAALLLLSQSELVAKRAVNLPLCVRAGEGGTHVHHKVHGFKEI